MSRFRVIAVQDKEINVIKVNLNDSFKLPNNIVYIDNELIVAPDIPSWILLPSETHKFVFNEIKKGRNLIDIINVCSKKYNYNKCIKAISNIVVQIYIKKFRDNSYKKENRFLEKMKIYITNACNLRCKHCFIKADKPLPNELTTEEIINLITNFIKNGGKILTITGGEPLVRKDIFEILRFAKNSGLFIVLLTNGTLINENNVGDIIRYVDQIQISVDGPNAKTHDAIRGPGTFRKVMKAINLLANSRVDIFISMTPVPRFIDINSFLKDFPIFIKKMKKYNNVKAINVNLVLLPGRFISKKDIDNYTQFATELTLKYLKREEELALGFLHLNVKIVSCGYAEVLTVLPNGDIKPCYPSPTIIGNIRRDSFNTIIDKLRVLFEAHKVDKIPICSTCPLRYFCGGWCRLKLKEFNIKDYRECGKAKILIRAMKYFDKAMLNVLDTRMYKSV